MKNPRNLNATNLGGTGLTSESELQSYGGNTIPNRKVSYPVPDYYKPTHLVAIAQNHCDSSQKVYPILDRKISYPVPECYKPGPANPVSDRKISYPVPEYYKPNSAYGVPDRKISYPVPEYYKPNSP